MAAGFATVLYSLFADAPGEPVGDAVRSAWLVPGATLASLGASTVLNSFLCSMLGLGRQ
jgi:hypothetical protein